MIGYIEAYFNLFLVKYYKKYSSYQYGLNTVKRNEKIIVSLTSFPKRINTVWITIETLMRQSMKADEIILWLAKEQFPKKYEDLPKKLLELQDRGIKIKFCDDLKSHKKYFYVLQENPDDIVILVDDDMFYPTDTIKQLYKLHMKNPNDICVMTSQKIEPDVISLPSQWKNPKLNEKIISSCQVQIFTGSGSLYTPHCLDDDAFYKELILSLCPYADDLWLTFMAYKKGTKISSLSRWRPFPITIYGTHIDSLYCINAENGKNDEQWQNLIDRYPEEFKKWEEKYHGQDTVL